LFKKFRQVSAAARLQEEQLYEQIAQELESGERRDGLWVKALANAQGAEEKAQGLYIKYRVQSIKDEYELTSDLSIGLEQELLMEAEKAALAAIAAEALEVVPAVPAVKAVKDTSLFKKIGLDHQEENQRSASENADIATRIEIENIIKGSRWTDLKVRHPQEIKSWEQERLLSEFIAEYELVHFPLHEAAWRSDCNLVETLLVFGFDASLDNTDGRTVRDMAVGDNDIIELLESPWR